MTTDLRSIVDRFVQDITSAIHESVQLALGSALEGTSLSRRGRRANSVVRGVARTAAPSVGRARGQKRDPKDLEALSQKLRAHIAKNPGQRIEQIGEGLGIATRELNLPVKKLLGAKQISKKGQRRATTYFPK